MVTKFNEIASG